ncbi:MAG: metallophosphoesterase [Proteobacteria bacterium]|nr:metallophosphoesterase [Pseudomonadota bacterium]
MALFSVALPVSLRVSRDLALYEEYQVGSWLPILYYVMTFACLLLIGIIIRDIVWLIQRLITWIKKRKAKTASDEENPAISRREFFKKATTIAALGGAAALTPPSIYLAKTQRRVREFDIRLEKIPESLNGLKIAHLSDIHVGNTIFEQDIAKIVEETNALSPDLIVITGDMADGMPEHIGSWLNPMRNFKAKYGTWFVTGNHDHMWNAAGWCDVIRNLGIHVLDNEHEIVDIAGTKIAIAGAIDARGDRRRRKWQSDPEKALANIDPSLFRLMLVHQPSSVDRSIKAGADLVLLGHTHGGQCWPLNYLICYLHKYSRGLYYLENDKAAFVSCGTGYWGPPLRLGIPPEIDLHTLYHK